jgi:hypothetical protein
MISLDLIVGVPRSFTSGGTPPIDGALRAESGPFLNCEDGSILAFD